jgi:hypothetical protein
VSLLFSNPELIRNARIQLRPGRMIAAAVICAVISITVWTSVTRTDGDFSVDRSHGAAAVFALALYAQVAILLIGGGIYCLQSVNREKELNTFDYQRVTRLTALELAIGKLLGAPIGAYFVVLCLTPVALMGAIRGHVSARVVLGAYVILLMGCIAYHTLALLVSVLLRRTGGLVVAIFLFLALVGISSVDLSDAPVLNLHTISPFAVGDLIGQSSSAVARGLQSDGAVFQWTDAFLGKTVPHFIVLMVLYVTFAAWFLLGITRNIKRDPSVYEVYSPNQAFAFVSYVNLVILGFFPWLETFAGRDFFVTGKSYHEDGSSPVVVEQSLLTVSLWLFALLALILLRNRERVRQRVRRYGKNAAGLLAALWPAPYVVAGVALSGGAIIALISHYQHSGYWDVHLAIFEVAFLAVWLSRDALYLQWMSLRRAKRPLGAAILYLAVFYCSTAILFSALNVYNTARGAAFSGILLPSPLFVLTPAFWQDQKPLWMLALGAQVAEALVFWWLHAMRLREFEPGPSSEVAVNQKLPQHA